MTSFKKTDFLSTKLKLRLVGQGHWVKNEQRSGVKTFLTNNFANSFSTPNSGNYFSDHFDKD